MKNPIIAAIRHTLRHGIKKIGKEYQLIMPPSQVVNMLNSIMMDKVFADLENEKGSILTRGQIPFC